MIFTSASVLNLASPRAILSLSGEHRSKYREKVNAPGRQENPVRGSANLLVPPLISFAAHREGKNRVIHDSDRSVTALRYGVWGESRNQITNSVPTDRLYTGQEKAGNLGFYDYHARWYDPSMGRFLQPDSLIPELYNPLALDRYGYVHNDPVNNTDSTGHSVDCAYGEYGCRAGVLYPEGLINLYYPHKEDFANRICESCEGKRQTLGKDLDDFLRKNLKYDPLKEIAKDENKWRIFHNLRLEYWDNREGVSLGEAYNLEDYYDLQKNLQILNFDVSKIDLSSVALDGSGFVLGFFGLNSLTNSLKIPASVSKNAANTGTALGLVTAGKSAINGDYLGVTFGVAGFIPGPIGIASSGISLLGDISSGFYFTPYKPVVPR